MGGFLAAVLGFPTVLFTFALVVVIAFWVVVVAGGTDPDVLDGDGSDVADAGRLDGLGLGGVPVTVVLSLFVAFAWFAALAGAALLDGALLHTVVLLVALVLAGLLTRLAVAPLRRLFPAPGGDSRRAFVGRSCVIRTGTVTDTFGQAEVTAADGSSAVVQVRQTGTDTFTAGATAVIYDYDPAGEFFWVVPTPGTATPGHHTPGHKG